MNPSVSDMAETRDDLNCGRGCPCCRRDHRWRDVPPAEIVRLLTQEQFCVNCDQPERQEARVCRAGLEMQGYWMKPIPKSGPSVFRRLPPQPSVSPVSGASPPLAGDDLRNVSLKEILAMIK